MGWRRPNSLKILEGGTAVFKYSVRRASRAALARLRGAMVVSQLGVSTLARQAGYFGSVSRLSCQQKWEKMSANVLFNENRLRMAVI